jgi:dipeptidyl aminopeptidase/acylaminoacyl peptidase
MRRLIAVLPLLALSASASRAQRPNPVNLWVVDLRWTGDRLTVGAPVKLTHDEGNNSQPSFAPDGRAVVFSATRDTGATARSDIYRIDLATRTETRVTHTPENENSPTMNERGEYVAVRWQPVTLFKEFGVWVYAADGTPKQGVLRGPDTTGYYTPLPSGDYALTRPKSRTFTLGIFDAKTGAITDVDSGLPALPAQRVPGERALSYVRVDSSNARHSIRRFDLDTRKVTTLAPTLLGRTVHAWAGAHGTMLMAKGNVLYARAAGRDAAWRVVATFDNPELRNASAYAVSPKGDRLVLTSPQRLALATVLRDSLEAGLGGREVAAMVLAWRNAGRLGDFDVAEGALGALGDERLQRRHTADAVAIHALATTLFPSSHRAFARLGDAQRATGESAAAIGAYRKSLELNTRATEADRSAAALVERKLGPLPAVAPSIAGEWDASMNTPGGVRNFRIVFKVSGDTLTGTVKREAGDVPLFGTIKGNTVKFSYTVMYNSNALELTMTATLDGDSMKGTVDMGGVAQDDFWAKKAG